MEVLTDDDKKKKRYNRENDEMKLFVLQGCGDALQRKIKVNKPRPSPLILSCPLITQRPLDD